MNKDEMDRRVCMMLGVEESNRPLVAQITQAFLLSITHQLAVGGGVELDEFGSFEAAFGAFEEAGEATIAFTPDGFCRHFIACYQEPRG